MRTLIFFALIALLSACQDETESLTGKDIEVFQEEIFNSLVDYNLTPDDAELLPDNSLIVIGSSIDNILSPKDPISVRLKENRECINVFPQDGRIVFKEMDMIISEDEHLVYCSELRRSGNTDLFIQKSSLSGNPVWVNTYGDKNLDERAVSVTEILDDNYVVLGDILGELFQNKEYHLSRVDSNGDIAWSKTIEDESTISEMRKVLYLSSDNTILVLGEYSNGPTPTQLKLTKFSVDGLLLSSRVIVDNERIWNSSSDMRLMEGGNILIYFTERGNSSNSANTQIQLVNINAQLEDNWVRSYEGVSPNIVEYIYEASNGDMLVLSSGSAVSDDLDIVLTRLDSNSEVKWEKAYRTSSSDQGIKLFEKPNQNILIIGSSNHNFDFEVDFEMVMFETDSNGVPQ